MGPVRRMTVPTASARAGAARSKDTRRAMYEMPAFAAGSVVALIEDALRLCNHAAKQGGPVVVLDSLAGRLQEAKVKTGEWMAKARMVTDYDCARKYVSERGQ